MRRFVAAFCAFASLSAMALNEPSVVVIKKNSVPITLEEPIGHTDPKPDVEYKNGSLGFKGTGHHLGYSIEGLSLVGDQLVADKVSLSLQFDKITPMAMLPQFKYENFSLKKTGESWQHSDGLVLSNQTGTVATKKDLKPEKKPRLTLPGATPFELTADPTSKAPRLRFTNHTDVADALKKGIDENFTDEYLNDVIDFDVKTLPDGLRQLAEKLIKDNRKDIYKEMRKGLKEEAGKESTLANLEKELAKELPPMSLNNHAVAGHLDLNRGEQAYSSVTLGSKPPAINIGGDSIVVAANEMALNLATPLAWHRHMADLREGDAKARSEMALVLSSFNAAQIPPENVDQVWFRAPADGIPTVEIAGASGNRKIVIQATLVVAKVIDKDKSEFLTIPVKATFSVQDNQLVCDQLEGRQPGAIPKVGAYNRLQVAFQLGLYRLGLNRELTKEQRQRGVRVETLEADNEPHLVLRVQ